jgi:hypothetical protein
LMLFIICGCKTICATKRPPKKKKGGVYINFVFKNLNSNFFPQTMISRFNLLPHLHFHYLSLIESLFDSSFGK